MTRSQAHRTPTLVDRSVRTRFRPAAVLGALALGLLALLPGSRPDSAALPSLSLSSLSWAAPPVNPAIFEFHSPNDGEPIDLFTSVVFKTGHPDGALVKVFADGVPIGSAPVTGSQTPVLISTALMNNGPSNFQGILYAANGNPLLSDLRTLDVHRPELSVAVAPAAGGQFSVELSFEGVEGDLSYQILSSDTIDVTPSPAYGCVLPIDPAISVGLGAGTFGPAYDGDTVDFTTLESPSGSATTYYVAVATLGADGRWRVSEAVEVVIPAAPPAPTLNPSAR